MLRTVIVVKLLVFLHIGDLSGQACGRGTFIVQIFQLTGEAPMEFSYEILPASQATLTGMEKADHHRGKQLHRSKINDTVDPRDQQLLDERLQELHAKDHGNITNGVKEFRTWELLNYHCILKISSGDTDLFVLANFFGGCDTHLSVL